MKKTILLAAAFSLVAAGTVQALDSTTGSHLAPAGSGIQGSKHDLSSFTGLDTFYPAVNEQDGGADPLDRICIWCHAPHHTMTTAEAAGILYLPLWNHEVTHQTYTVYESDFGDGPDPSGMAGVGVVGSNEQFADRHLFNGRATIGQPGGVSRLCLSCHDGTVAINNYGRDKQRDYSESGRDNSGAMINAQWEIGANPYGLLNHHPIGFSYLDVALHDDEIADPATPIVGSGTPELTTIGSLLYGGGRMECVTCHDVHNSKNTGETFLWISDRQSAFCLTCHLK